VVVSPFEAAAADNGIQFVRQHSSLPSAASVKRGSRLRLRHALQDSRHLELKPSGRGAPRRDDDPTVRGPPRGVGASRCSTICRGAGPRRTCRGCSNRPLLSSQIMLLQIRQLEREQSPESVAFNVSRTAPARRCRLRPGRRRDIAHWSYAWRGELGPMAGGVQDLFKALFAVRIGRCV